MTIDDFFRTLAELRELNWRILSTGLIRGYDINMIPCCPITAVARHLGHGKFNILEHYDAGGVIGLDDATIGDIVNSADSRYICNTSKSYRNRMLKALGLIDP